MENNVDLKKVAAGVFANLGGQPLDFAIEQVLNRAGLHHTVPVTDTEGAETGQWEAHPLRASLTNTHGGDTNPAILRLPIVFPPAGYDGPLMSAQDYLDLIESVRPEAQAEADARVKAIQQAEIDAAAPALADALQALPHGEALAGSLSDVGLDTVGKVQAATTEQLQSAQGVGPKTAETILAAVNDVAAGLPDLMTTEAAGSVTAAAGDVPAALSPEITLSPEIIAL